MPVRDPADSTHPPSSAGDPSPGRARRSAGAPAEQAPRPWCTYCGAVATDTDRRWPACVDCQRIERIVQAALENVDDSSPEAGATCADPKADPAPKPASFFRVPTWWIDDLDDTTLFWCDDGRLMVSADEFLAASLEPSPSARLRRLADRIDNFEATRQPATARLPWADYVEEQVA